MNAEPIHVLLVENAWEDAARIKRQLSGTGVAHFELERVSQTSDAVARLRNDHVDVVLLHLPANEALQLLPRIEELAVNIPVVVLSEDEDESAAVQAVRAGAQDYLVRSKIDARTLAHGLRYAIERKRAEEALEKSEAFYHSLVETLPQNVYRKDLEGRFTFGNGRFCAGIGRPLDQIVGKTDFDFFPPELAKKYREDDQRVIETGKAFDVVEKHITPSGDTLYVQVIKTTVYDSTGKVIGTQGIFWDVTERFRSEEQLKAAYVELAAKDAELLKSMEMLKASHEELIQAQLHLIQAEKMESVGRLAAGVAHEVKNPLAIMLMGLDYLDQGGTRDQTADHEVRRAMRDAVYRADAIVRGLVDFSAERKLDTVKTDLNAMIQQALLLVKHELIGGHISTDCQFCADLPPLLLDKTKIQQVFINLFMNAIQAMPKGGTLIVRTTLNGAKIVEAEVLDSGTGIPADKLSKVFDPFFTTKAPGRGTGLGLTVTRKILELHNAQITISNRPEGGAKVSLTFKINGSQHAQGKTTDPSRATQANPHHR